MLKTNSYFKKLKGVATILALAGMVVFTGCKKNLHEEGSGSNYPFTWQEKANGRIVVKLDGSHSADYSWAAVSEDESIATVEAKKEEKNGIIKYTIYPKGEGRTTIVFTREKETGEKAYDGEPIENTEEPSEVKPVDEGNVVEEAGSEDAGEESEPDEYAEMYNQNYFNSMVTENKVCVIRLDVTVEPKGKKFKALGSFIGLTEQEGLKVVEGEAVDYRYWFAEDGSLNVRIPHTENGWIYDVTCKYTGEEADEDGVIVDENGQPLYGLVPDEVPADENGKNLTVDVSEVGSYEGEAVFSITGLAEGEATVLFKSPKEGLMVKFELTVSASGEIKVASHEATTYKATAGEVQRQTMDEPLIKDEEIPSEGVDPDADEENPDGENKPEGEDNPEADKLLQDDGSKG